VLGNVPDDVKAPCEQGIGTGQIKNAQIVWEPENGPVWPKLTGPQGVRDLRQEARNRYPEWPPVRQSFQFKLFG
jgi:hypothetical protein